MDLNNRGQFVIGLGIFIALAFVFITTLGVYLYVFGQIDKAITGNNIIAGSTNISNYSANTIGQVNTAFLNTADLIGILFLFGVVIGMLISGYINREQSGAFLFVIDLILMVLFYIGAVYISNAYESTLSSLPYVNQVASNLAGANNILLNLPLYTIIAGAITMIVSYSAIPKSREEEVGGF